MSRIWERVYELRVGNDGETLTIDGFGEQPAQVRFNVSILPSTTLSLAEITVFGLSRENRYLIYERYKRISLIAGYRNDHASIFQGAIYNVSIGKEGPESYVTMYCRSTADAWESAFINKAWAAGTPAVDVVIDVAKTFGLPVRVYGDMSNLPPYMLGASLTGNSKHVMRKLCRNFGLQWVIDRSELIIAKEDVDLDSSTQTFHISAETGMIGTPLVNERGIDVTSVMLPALKPKDQIVVENATGEIGFSNPIATHFPDTIGTGNYMAGAIHHQGDYAAGQWITTIEAWSPRTSEVSR